ncbi:MAG: hypothetical protein D4R64_05340 [Porphyromonadaceae bacterium]|nr:MAG: hypothetical protein D4R64_05340 [Porphyromonadaceae bacterium]
MFRFIRSISFTVQVMIPILGLILFVIAWFLPGNLQPGNIYGNGFFYQPADGWLYPLWTGMSRLPLWAQMIPSCLIMVLTAWLLVRTDMKNLLMGSRSYAIAFVFLLLVTSNGHFFLFHPALLAGYFMILSYRFLLDLYKEETGYSIVFAMGFSWGVAILLYPPFCFLIPAILIGLLLMVTTNWRHWLVSLMGIVVPALLVAVFWFLMGDLNYEIVTFFSWFKLRHTIFPVFISKEPFIAAWFGLILIWIVIASWKYRNPKIQSRQLFQANFLLFLSILLMTVFLETVSVEVLWLLIIPVSYLMTFWALKVGKGWMRDLFFFSLLLFFFFFRIRSLI